MEARLVERNITRERVAPELVATFVAFTVARLPVYHMPLCLCELFLQLNLPLPLPAAERPLQSGPHYKRGTCVLDPDLFSAVPFWGDKCYGPTTDPQYPQRVHPNQFASE